MCTVSNVGDYWNKQWPDRHPWVDPYIQPGVNPTNPFLPNINGPTREEFEALKKDIEALKELLKAAKKFDEETNQPHCEHEDKVALIKKMAELVGVDLKDVLD
jgi:hypothetical protein